MKNIVLVLAVLVLAGCNPAAEDKPPVLTDTPLEKAEAPIAKVDKIVVQEWFDYGCGHCRTSHETLKDLKDRYGDRLEVMERHFPLSANTYLFAEASECARDQQKFAEFHDAVFTDYYGQFDPKNVSKIANAVGIPDIETFNTCVTSGASKDEVARDVQAAEKLGVSGTPFFLINDELSIPGAISGQSFQSLFDQLLLDEEA